MGTFPNGNTKYGKVSIMLTTLKKIKSGWSQTLGSLISNHEVVRWLRLFIVIGSEIS